MADKPKKKRRILDNGDEVADMLRDATSEADLKAIADKHGLSEKWASWSNLGPGQRRMCIGNALRGKFRREAKAAA